MTLPVTIFTVAETILKYPPKTGADFEKAGLPMFGGCECCQESLAAYNAYPAKTGFIRCKACIGNLGWLDAEECVVDIFRD